MTRNAIPVKFGLNDNLGHVMTKREMAFSQGWPVIPTAANGRFSDAMLFDFESGEDDMRHFLGNGMHLAALSPSSVTSSLTWFGATQ